MENLKTLRGKIGSIIGISFVAAFLFFLMALAEPGFLVLVSLAVTVIGLCIDFIIAYDFYEVALEKGYQNTKYFWYCFILSAVGYILVTALPAKSVASNINDELPEL